MSFTYDFSTSPAIANVRLLVGDTDAANPVFQDAEVNAALQAESSQNLILGLSGFSPNPPVQQIYCYRRSAAWLLNALAANLSRLGSVISQLLDVKLAPGIASKELRSQAQALIDQYKALAAKVTTQTQSVGEISGFKVAFTGQNLAGQYIAKLVLETPEQIDLALDAGTNLVGMTMRATNALSAIAGFPAKLRERIVEARAQVDALATRLQTPFPMAQMLILRYHQQLLLDLRHPN